MKGMHASFCNINDTYCRYGATNMAFGVVQTHIGDKSRYWIIGVAYSIEIFIFSGRILHWREDGK